MPILREIQFNILQQTAQHPLTSILPAPLDNTLTIQIIMLIYTLRVLYRSKNEKNI